MWLTAKLISVSASCYLRAKRSRKLRGVRRKSLTPEWMLVWHKPCSNWLRVRSPVIGRRITAQQQTADALQRERTRTRLVFFGLCYVFSTSFRRASALFWCCVILLRPWDTNKWALVRNLALNWVSIDVGAPATNILAVKMATLNPPVRFPSLLFPTPFSLLTTCIGSMSRFLSV